MNGMPMLSPAMMALTTAAMMVAMMLPSVAPTFWKHHRRLRAMRVSRAAERTTLFALGYAGVWALIGLALVATSAALSQMEVAPNASRPFAPWLAAVVLCAGVLQRSDWKARRLDRCRDACIDERAARMSLAAAWREGCGLGIDCCLSCAAPMAVLLAAGLMDTRMMTMVTAAITAERLAPAGARIARLTGGFMLVAGTLICA